MHAVLCARSEVSVVASDRIETELLYLRKGLDDVKIDVRELRADNRTMREKIDAMGAEIKTMNAAWGDQFRMMRENIADLRAMQKAILWVLGSTGSLAALVTIVKSLDVL
jgi:hypothetical protein